MRRSSEIPILLAALLLSGVSGKTLKNADDFHLTECVWDGQKCAEVNRFHPEEGWLYDVSDWPPGPYAIPMSIDGCPESRRKGWHQGYIDFTWKEPHNVFSSDTRVIDKEFDGINVTSFEDITDTTLPYTQSALLGPYSRYRVKLNFCFKSKRKSSLDRGSWFDGNYTIYGDKSGCPSGFEEKYTDIQLAKVKHWISDGQLPQFKVNRTNEDIDLLQILQCLWKHNDGDAHKAWSFPLNSPFILLMSQNNDRNYASCTPIPDMELTVVYMYLFPSNTEENRSDANALKVFVAFCYYFPNTWINGTVLGRPIGTPIPKASFIVRVMDVTTGHLSVDTMVRHSGQQPTQTSILNHISESFSHSVEVQWKLLDLGRSMSVVALSVDFATRDQSFDVVDTARFAGFTDNNYEMFFFVSKLYECIDWQDVEGLGLTNKDFPDSSIEDAGRSCRDPLKLGHLYCFSHEAALLWTECEGFRWREKDDTFPKCFISEGKWDFRHFGALSCKYEVHYEDDTISKRLHMLFYRSMKGRYIALAGEVDLYSDKNILEKDTRINVLTNVDIFRNEEEDTCNMDLGMSDETIRDHQISSSSSQPSFPASAARPFLYSWCAKSADTDPFIMIDLLDLLKVESVSIWNWGNIYQTVSDGSVNKDFLEIGVRSFRVSFGKTAWNISSYDDKVFLLDALYNVDTPQTFMLYKPVYAQFVNIQILDPLTQNISCLRIELSGCRTNDHRPASPVVAYEAAQRMDFRTNATVLSLSSVVTEDAILRSIGYPYGYRNGESYKWIIHFDKFIQLIFTKVSLNIYQHQQGVDSCDDVILLNEELYIYNTTKKFSSIVPNWNIGNKAGNFIIDSSFNGKTFIIDTDKTILTVTFASCQRLGKMINRGEGFRVLALKQDIPACFTLDTFDQHSNSRVEKCEMLTMTLTSMSFFNIEFHGTTEKWIIHQEKGYFRFEVLHFDIKCDTGSKFVIADRFGGGKEFCNQNKPPRIYYTTSSSVNVTFEKYSAKSKESFRLIYYNVHEEIPETVTTKAANIPDIVSSIAREADITNDQSLGVDPQSQVRLLYKVCSRRFDKCYSVFSVFRSWISAGKECLIRKHRLVSIRSPDEMHLVKYILRNFKFLDIDKEWFRTAFRHDKIDYYYAYIGLYRVASGNDGRMFDLWEDNTPVTFSAWKPGEPSAGDCTRMGFYKATDNDTWESVDCLKRAAFYFICEYDIADRSIALQDRVFIEDYTGNHSVTIRGFTCQRWDSQYPHKHYLNDNEFFPDASVSDAGNYCRDLDRKHLWCYTTNPDVEKDLCYPNELLEEVSPRTYSGRLRYTSTGQICKKWTDAYYFYNETISEASDYCRLPVVSIDGKTIVSASQVSLSNLWCFVDKSQREYCSLPDTASDRCVNTHYTYSGYWNVTFSGKVCIRWDSIYQANNIIMNFEFPDETIIDAENFCRDPTYEGFQWCYTSENDLTWEPCIVQYGDTADEIASETGNRIYFTCRNGEEVNMHARCNGLIDCFDASDEEQCISIGNNVIDTSTLPSGSDSEMYEGLIFLCKTNELISFLAYCDGIVDCNDASDETNCSQRTPRNAGERCGDEHFQCGDGSCIHLSLICNFISDCLDSSDEMCEYGMCSPDEYTCATGQCISKSRRCDYFIDCLDGSDENACESCSSDDVFHCDYVRCLPKRFLCDRYPDCDDGSDEASCDWSDVLSCPMWWDIGYRKTGTYTAQYSYNGEVEVTCDFSDLIKKQKVYTIFPNVDRMYWEEEHYKVFVIYTHMYQGRPMDGAFELYFEKIFNNENIECKHQIVQSCIPALQSAWEVDDASQNQTNTDCICINATVKIDLFPNIESYTYCNTDESLSDEDMSKVYFSYTYDSHRGLSWKDLDKNYSHLQLNIGQITCVEDYKPELLQLGCDEGRKVFPESVRCMYDVDRSQNVIGCRSGSHLQDCDSFTCPPATMKCPNSYCIPLRFVCDGKKQCTNGEDEKYCGCNEEEREIVILQEDGEYRGPDITEMVKQLSNTDSIIRHLLYTSENIQNELPFQRRLLRIRDKEIKPFEVIDREYECNYKAIANDFVHVLKFSKQSSRALIFIQSSMESQLVADAMFGNISKNPCYSIYRTWEEATPSNSKINENKYVTEVQVTNWNKLTSLAARYFPDICKENHPMVCPNAYKCASSKMCISLEQVCDGHFDCIHGEDESLCNFVCPIGCQCNGFALTCDSYYLNSTVIPVEKYPKSTRSLTISNNDGSKKLEVEEVFDFPFLYLMNISHCGLETIPPNKFIRTINLRILDISFNSLTHLSGAMFKGLAKVQIIHLDGNHHISTIDAYAFKPLQSIRKLRLANTRVRKILSNTFADLTLDYLEVSENNIKEIEEFGFGNLHAKHVDFYSNVILNYDKGIFTGLSSVVSLRTPAFKFCCVRPNYVPEDKCFPRKDEFSSCEDLMRISALQTMIWLIGLCALLGNILAVLYRLIYDRERLKLGYGVFVTNLAVADFLMGAYLIIIAVADAVFRKRYIFMDDYWRNSPWCTLAGVLSTLSSEASVIFLCFITIDRLIVIKYPFGQFRFDTKKALMCSALAWFISLLIALSPLMYTGYFKNGFYSKSGVCIALPLTKDRPPGWLYSVLIFVCLNFVAFLLIALGQWSIYMNISKSRVAGATKNRKKDLTVSRNLLLVVSTDFLCWFPIGCVGMMAMSGNVISGDVYAWAAVFILPVNSALNPILYTLPAILGKKSFTPRTGEQSAKPIKTGLGKTFLAIKNITTRRFYVHKRHDKGSYVSLQERLQRKEPFDQVTILKIGLQIAEILCVLHKNSLVLEQLDGETVYVRIREDQTVEEIEVRQEPKICRKMGEQYNDVYKMGQLLQSMLHKYR